MTNWKTLSSKVIYKNKWLSLREDSVITPNGSDGIYSVIDLASDFLYVVAINQQKEIYLTEQYRYPIQQTSWELPAGQTDGEPIEIAARRELLEETGHSTKALTKIGEIFSDTGVFSGKGHIFVAEDIEKVTDELDPEDGITQAKPFSIPQIHDMIISGEIQCPHSISAFYLAKNYLETKNI